MNAQPLTHQQWHDLPITQRTRLMLAAKGSMFHNANSTDIFTRARQLAGQEQATNRTIK